jgi:tripeptidyl-peptidase-1
MFNAGFPASCPYVTGVGATQVKANASVTHPEAAAESIIYSGGGFSHVFDMPTYQIDATQNHFANHKPLWLRSLQHHSENLAASQMSLPTEATPPWQ